MEKGLECIRDLSLALLATVTLVRCSASGTSGGASELQSSKSEDVETTEFAAMGPMTGDAAGFGQQQKYGVRLAVQEINKNGGTNGKRFVYDVYNDQMNANQTVICTEKMATANKYRFVVTSVSISCSKVAYPTWANIGLPALSGTSAGDIITELRYKNYLRIYAEDSAIIEQMCDYVVNRCGVKKPVILYTSADTDITNFDFTKNYLKDKYNIDVIGSAQVQVEVEKSYAAYITNFKGRGAGTVYLFTEYNPAGLFLKQKTSPGWDAQVFRNTGRANPLIFQMADAKCMEEFITTSALDAESTNERIRKLVKNCTKLTGMNPSQGTTGPHDLIYMVSEVLKNKETNDLNGNALVEWLRSNASYSGIMMGVGGSDADRDNLNVKPHMLTAKNGTYVRIDEKQREIKGGR